MHVGVLCISSVKLTIRVRSGSISIPGDEFDEFSSFTANGTYMHQIFFELLKKIVSLPILSAQKSEDMKN